MSHPYHIALKLKKALSLPELYLNQRQVIIDFSLEK